MLGEGGRRRGWSGFFLFGVGLVAGNLRGGEKSIFCGMKGAVLPEIRGGGRAAEEGCGRALADPDAPIFLVGKVRYSRTGVLGAELAGEGAHELAWGGVLGGSRGLSKEPSANFETGGAFDVSEFVVKIFRAWGLSGEEIFGVVEVSGRAWGASGGIFLGFAGKSGEGSGIGAEGAGS